MKFFLSILYDKNMQHSKMYLTHIFLQLKALNTSHKTHLTVCDKIYTYKQLTSYFQDMIVYS